ncbi:MAG TPA: hypothetical protein VFV19_14095 [Candidatus Polarisedimenticolaceae bacterium]|nr:hypothetical protein [Candidatus Polarisedimenticolaceae bacterium]
MKRAHVLRVAAALALGLLAAPRPATAQCTTGFKPRILVLADTSGSMTRRMADGVLSGGDGSTVFSDAIMTRQITAIPPNGPGFALYPGYKLTGACPTTSMTPSSYDGINSRMYAMKAALSDSLTAASDVQWGLERYSGTTCPVVNTTGPAGAACTSDATCPLYSFCIGGSCKQDNNLCYDAPAYDIACDVHNDTAATYNGDCGTTVAAGNTACATPQVCYADADCAAGFSGQCALIAGGPAASCACTGPSDCPAGYACSANRCVYNASCQNPGGVILVDPTSPTPTTQVLPWLDGVEGLPGGSAGTNPELRASGAGPVAGAARSATAWYNAIKNGNQDPQILCRPYVLVEIVDGLDNCETDTVNGPVAAAGSFVAATVSGAKHANKVYVIGLGFGAGPVPGLDAIAKAGGTGTARLANSRADIDAALNDVVQASVVSSNELCNGIDDNCNGQCDENFPDVAVSGPGCSNAHAARACSNGAVTATHCFASGVYTCAADQRGEVCNAPTCATNPALCPTAEAAGGCNGVDDDCNGVIDDCTPNVAGSCCQ